jgi:hypothetical protein
MLSATSTGLKGNRRVEVAEEEDKTDKQQFINDVAGRMRAATMSCIQGIVIKLAMVAGNIMIEDAKIGGITPDVLIFKGKWVLCPPYILRPTTRLAYCTGMRRCPCSTKMMNPTTSHHQTTSSRMQ